MTTKADKTSMKSENKVFEFKHQNGDVFTYDNDKHEYRLNGVELPGTTTPLKLVNELSWDENGKMTDKSQIIQAWAIKMVTNEILQQTSGEPKDKCWWTTAQIEEIVMKAKGAPMRKFKDAGLSGTDIHALCEKYIKHCISEHKGEAWLDGTYQAVPQVENFMNWAWENEVKFLFSEEPIYSKEWMNCGTVDFICEIDGKILIGDIKTNGDKRRYGGKMIKGKWVEDLNKPQSDIHVPALWQTACYGKMATEEGARKLIDKFDGVCIVNIKKSGEFDEKLDTRYDYAIDSLIRAYEHVLGLYKEFRRKI
jgi:hypothetical protein